MPIEAAIKAASVEIGIGEPCGVRILCAFEPHLLSSLVAGASGAHAVVISSSMSTVLLSSPRAPRSMHQEAMLQTFLRNSVPLLKDMPEEAMGAMAARLEARVYCEGEVTIKALTPYLLH